jgi:crotonobetainyl-CoA:carnitine CoA-transferase CaiB-like acyl-CoA transferase
MTDAPLSHLRVVDLTDLRGALAGRLLGDLGADVIKIEPSGGDPGRLQPPFAGGVAAPDRSLPFLYRHANKRGAVIDLYDAAGWDRFVELCDRADILLENFGPDGQQRRRLTPAEVRARHPHLIHVAMADFGLSGPRAGWRAEPLPAFASSGALFASGFLDRPPCWLPGYMAHDCASVFAAVGTVAAVLDRARHGEGQTVEVSVQEAALNGLTPWSIPVGDYAQLYPLVLQTSRPREADGMYMVLPAADGFIRLLPATVRQWKAFVELTGNIEELSGPEWELPVYRLLYGETIRQLATGALRQRSRDEVFAEGVRLRLPITPVNTPDQFVAEEQTRVRGYFRCTGFPHLGDAPFAPAPLNFSRTPTVLRRPAPAPGEDDGADFSPRDLEKPSGAAENPLLAGMLVIDLGVGAVGPEIGWVLAELGAEVIKIESRENLDFLRAVTVEPDQPNRAWTFDVEGRGQKSVCLNLRTVRGRELALQLCAAADVVIENNRGGVVRQLGLDYEDVRRVRPDVIYIASQGFGRGGPMGEAPSFGPLNSSFVGSNWLWNHPDTPYPAGSTLNHPDHIASKLGAAAVLSALEHRRRTGEGQFIEMAQTEAAAYFLGEFYLQGPCTGQPPQRRGNASEFAVPHNVYPCAGEDRWCAIAVVDDAGWQRFVRCLGWPEEQRFATAAGRLAAREEIDARVAEWTRTRTPEEAAATLQAAGVSAMPVQNADDHRADPHLAARGAIVTVQQPEIGPERHIGNPLHMSRTPLVTAGAAPLLDADTHDVLTRVLGLQASEVEQLISERVCY